MTEPFDLILVGGGLQNGLIALAALQHAPNRRVALIERDARPGGNHTWCMHSLDLPLSARNFAAPLIAHSWAGYDVRFPGLSRTVTGAYCAITSQRFAGRVLSVMRQAPGGALFLDAPVREVSPNSVELLDGRSLSAQLVVDARGPERDRLAGSCGFQKFVGLELEYCAPHGVERPIVMDACVPQLDGYRFFYVLPLGPTRLLVEDTRFAREPGLDRDAVREEVRRYAARFGALQCELREESGVLPMPWAGELAAPEASPLVAGYRGGFFHPATGYSFPAAVRLAEHIGTRPSSDVFGRRLSRLVQAHAAQFQYAQRLNWLLFHGFDARDMWNVFERFYRLPDALIHRFYALSLTPLDRARIMLGKPPAGFRLSNALKASSEPIIEALLPTGWGRPR